MTNPELRPQLVEVGGPHAGRAHDLPYGEHVLGRGGTASIALDHKDVSRQHARIDVGPEGMLVHDLGSKNGVHHGGQRVQAPVLLTHGQTFSLGELSLRIVHPASQVAGALARAGETTVTTMGPGDAAAAQGRSLLLPLVAVVLFGVLVAVSIMMM